MPRMNLRTALLVSVLAAAACKKAEDKPAAPAAPTTPAPTAPTGPVAGTPVENPLVGKPAPDFTLKDLDGKEVALSSFKGKTVVLEWFNPGCPYVKKSHTVGSLVDTARKHTDKGVVWLAINSGAPGKQGADPVENAQAVESWTLGHPVLRDEFGTVGKAYGATNTPNMFVIDSSGTIVYAGAIDNSPDGERQSPVGGTLINFVDAALDDLAAGRPVKTPATKPYGCGVKYAS